MHAVNIRTLILFTTTRLGHRAEELVRLDTSVNRLRQEMPYLRVDHHLLLQAAPDGTEIQGNWTLQTTPKLLGLSTARNMLLADLPKYLLTDNAVIAYPDDDAWYVDASLADVVTAFEEDPLLDFWFTRSGQDPTWPGYKVMRSPSLQQLLSNATSNTIFLRGSMVARLGGFDESLGLGTSAISGEDTDYALRAFRLARKTMFLATATVGHRHPDRRDRELYFEGALYAIAKHALALRGGKYALVRKIAIGLILTLGGRIGHKQFFGSLRIAFGLLLKTRY
jgi:GT2 family glycosyltransferase